MEYLDCPCCGDDVLGREEAYWHEDEQEKCPSCGCNVSVRVDDGCDPPKAYTTVIDGDEGPGCRA